MAFSPNRSGSPTRHDYNVQGHPPFNVATKRFNKHDTKSIEGPEYHVAYRDTTAQETRRSTKGWAAMDDAIKPKRGTGAGKVFSSLAPRTAPPAPGSQLQPIYTSYPNETRLQELLDLQRRRLGQGPGPGQYQVTGWQPTRTCFRRQAIPQLDGPFLPPKDPSQVFQTTRGKEMGTTLLNSDSGVAPGEYDGHLGKDAVQKAAPGFSIGMGAREGKVKHPKSLSVSRSIQHGIDWHIPVLIQVRPAGADAAKPESRSPPRPPQPAGEEYWGEGQEDGSPDRGRGADPSLPPPVGGKVPPPPAAVARSIRRPVQGAPSEWDWQRLGHNYRNNWTTLHGGAFSQGDRSTSRRDVALPDAVDYMGTHTESIDPSALPRENLGSMFPIPEEGLDAAIMGRAQARLDPEGYAPPGSAYRPPSNSLPSTASSALPHPGLGPLGPPGYPRSEVDPGSPMGPVQPPVDRLLSHAEMARRDAAMQAAMQVQQAALRRAQWLAKDPGIVF